MGIERRFEGSNHIENYKDGAAIISLVFEILPEELLMNGLGGPEYQKLERALEDAFNASATLDPQQLQEIIEKTVETELKPFTRNSSGIARSLVEKIRKEVDVQHE